MAYIRILSEIHQGHVGNTWGIQKGNMESTWGIPLELFLGVTVGINTSVIHAECVGNTMEMREDSSNGYVSVM